MKRIDIKKTISEELERAWAYEEQALLDNACECLDWLTYYESNIIDFFKENEMEHIEWLMDKDNAFWWIDECLSVSHGYFACSYEFSVIHTNEIEIPLDTLFPTGIPLKKSVIEAINHNTDMYVPDNGLYGYASTDMLSICIDANKVKEWVKENIETITE